MNSKTIVWCGLFAVACSTGCSTKSGGASNLAPAWWVSTDRDGVSFSIEEQDGKLSGALWLKGLDTDSYVYGGELQGSHEGNNVTWTAGVISVTGTLSGARITGQITHAAFGGEPASTSSLELAEIKP